MPEPSAAVDHAIHLTTFVVVGCVALGFLAGVLGGLAGIGGSMLMLPGLTILLGKEPDSIQHLFIAAAFVVNVVVAYPAARRHRRSGAVRDDLLRELLISVLVAMVVGVVIGNFAPGAHLRIALGIFLVAYCAFNIYRVAFRFPEPDGAHARTGPAVLISCGAITGLFGGTLGLAGGVILVPLLQLVARLPLRSAIATSSAVVWTTAAVAAVLKLATLSQHGWSIWTSLTLTALMAPTALVGSQIGAGLTHKLPVKWVRIAITAVLAAAAARLLGLLA